MTDEDLDPDDISVPVGGCSREGCILTGLVPDLTANFLVNIIGHQVGINKKVLEDLCDGCTSGCIRKEIASRCYSDKQLRQQKAIADYQWLLGERGIEVSYGAAFMMWASNGLAEAFSRAYREIPAEDSSLTHSEVYTLFEKALSAVA
jgi:hypothetical protein